MNFLAIQHTYDTIEWALFKEQSVVARQSITKFEASALLIPMLETTLSTHQVTLADLAFIAANYGPGPFTTLRVVIASTNGIAFATQIPLIGIDGLHALMQEYRDTSCDQTICMLNAFNHDVYYAYTSPNGIITGSENGEQFLKTIAPHYATGTIQFLGNAVTSYRPLINELLQDRALITDVIPNTCSVEYIGLMGCAQWHAGNRGTNQLLPHYLKMQQFTKAS